MAGRFQGRLIDKGQHDITSRQFAGTANQPAEMIDRPGYRGSVGAYEVFVHIIIGADRLYPNAGLLAEPLDFGRPAIVAEGIFSLVRFFEYPLD